jgi:hypothetical protein
MRVLIVLVLAVVIVFLPLVPAAAQTGHEGVCLVVDNQTNETIHVTLSPSTDEVLILVYTIPAHTKFIAMGKDDGVLRWADYTMLNVLIVLAKSRVSWLWDGTFRLSSSTPGYVFPKAPSGSGELCPNGTWISIVK